MIRWMTRSLLALAALFLFSLPVAAGGWATVEFDPLPDEISAGEAVPLRFLLLQHAKTPVHEAFGQTIEATVNVYAKTSGETITFTAQPDTEVGYFRANVPFPLEGTYDVTVTTNVLDTSEVMPTRLTVAVSTPAPTVSSAVASAGLPIPVLPLLVGVLLVVAAIIASVRIRSARNPTTTAHLS